MLIPEEHELLYFGKDIWELYSFQTFSERRIGKEIVNEALSAMNYTGDESDAPDIAALARFYYFPYYKRPDRIEASVRLNKTAIRDDEGAVWFTYRFVSYDENDELIQGSWDILT